MEFLLADPYISRTGEVRSEEKEEKKTREEGEDGREVCGAASPFTGITEACCKSFRRHLIRAFK